ncbi:pyrimidine dimer DNA glycosylase/endonuclease V [Nesterenkonia sp. Act20]|uniref:pyrimidine dimer DNA glycosylase/endonuclease V n=1 Tax=Nesterenkonia sp. Act20 TaxID=1483432 RepID=UPI001C44DDDD|nr:pyrimidine dimer DNA glycosylase/endonuclease V [Nesterenkonia sp. Act20]
MRIWSLHPGHLDRQGLVACWRETLLAQAVLSGRTKGYLDHPQLLRFRAQADPLAAVGRYLQGVAEEADVRGYRFNRSKIIHSKTDTGEAIDVTAGQLALEWEHLAAKLERRSPEKARANQLAAQRQTPARPVPAPHPMMRVIPGGVEPWERASPGTEGITPPSS